MLDISERQDRDYSPFIRGISILVNTVGMAFYLGLSYVSLSSSTSMGEAWVSLTMWGLAPLIVTTYCLWYLKKADENVMGLFIVTPVVILFHYAVMGIAAHTGFWGVILSLIELAAAIAFVVIARSKGYVRHQPSTQSMKTHRDES